MVEYSDAFKSRMVQRMVGDRAVSATSLAMETGISQPTLSRWLRSVQDTSRPMSKRHKTSPTVTGRPSSPTPVPASAPSTPTAPARRAEDWSAEERLRVVSACAHLSEADLGAFLRREGLHEETLAEWRSAALDGLGGPRKATTDARRVRDLEKQLRRKDKALAEAAALLVLQKKVRQIWGDGDDDTDPRSDG